MNQVYALVTFPVEDRFAQVIQEARNSLFIAAPYIKDYGVQVVLDNTRAKNLRILTNLDLANVTGAGFDLESLLKLWDRYDLSVSSLGKLHAKVYIADSKVAFMTSANLTRGGLRENYEYGVVLRDEELVSAILADMNEYFKLGNTFSREKIASIKSDVEEIRDLRKGLEASEAAKRLRKVLRQKEENLQTKILRNRIEGKTINAIFAETIKYLLATKGPLSTEELHPLIKNIHSDICDDSIDRVINGQHFGKKWKHLVRNAQQSLKQNGVIALKERKWQLV
ncbi:MAG: phospholipase D family protein [Chloroflexota bacterium]